MVKTREQERAERTAQTRRWREANRERARAQSKAATKRWKERDPAAARASHAAAKRRWYAANREEILRKLREQTARNREEIGRRRRELREVDPDRAKRLARARKLKDKYGITMDEFDAMLHAQGGVCKLCMGPPNHKQPFAVDHCHVTGTIRGLLCFRCNRALGMLEDNAALLRRGAAYLETSQLREIVGW